MLRGWMVVAAIAAIASPASANTDSIDALPPRVTPMPALPFVGAGQHEVALAVPEWHGLEPSLAIAYSSAAKNGWLGYRMSLQGVSTIERVSAALGAPTYTASDRYLLDGEPMIACSAGSTSPSCTTGGTHTTKHERYVRIVKSGTSWTVTSPTGVVQRYSTLAEPVAVLTSRTDTSGNTVTYSYATTNGSSLLSAISYNGTTVTFVREGRPDVLHIGTGTGLRRIDSRLSTVTVRTDGALVRAYRLVYAAGANGRGSYLTSIREYGSDAVFNGAGVVTGGSSFPATTFAWNGDQPALTSTSVGSATRPVGSNDDVSLAADVNGDGRTDAIAINRYSSGGVSGTRGTLDVQVHLGRADGTFSPTQVRSTTTANASIGWYTEVRAGDVNGDGRGDLVFVYRQSRYSCCGIAPVGSVDVQLALGTASGGFTFPAAQRVSSEGTSAEYDDVLVADVDGDGRADLIAAYVKQQNGTYLELRTMTWLSNGVSFGATSAATVSVGGAFAGYRLHAGDVNGDGRDDLVAVYRSSRVCSGGAADSAVANTFLSLGNGSFGARIASTLTTGCTADSYAGDALVDVNQDGLADLVGDDAYTVFGAICSDCDSDVKIVANLGNGNGTFGAGIVSTGWSGANVWIGSFAAGFIDINGDGYPDRVGAKPGTNISLLVSYGRGDGTFELGAVASVSTATSSGFGTDGVTTTWADANTITFGDVDGDGRLSLVITKASATTFRFATLAPNAQFGGLPSTVTMPTGGSIGFDYTTSSSFPNGYLPFAFPVLSRSRILDGRGQTATTTYAYTGGLYVPTERRFFGFATTRITHGDGAISDMAYTQHVADPPGAVASHHRRTNTGSLVTYETTTFTRAGNGATVPYTSLPARRYAYECNGLATCKASSRGWTYSAYGAVTSEIEYGDDAITGDERTTFRTQAPNATAFITQLDATITVRAGAGNATGTQLAYTELAYDGAASAATPPTRGLLTQTKRWRGGTDHVVERTQYDASGNQTATIDPLGNTTTLAYDARHRPTSKVNALGHAETRTYDALGRVNTITDANDATTSHEYDALGRVIRRTRPDGGVETAAYTNWGNATSQFVTTTISDGTADGLWTRTYLDGLARPVRVIVEGGITTDTTYNLRGLVSARSAPYLTGATPVWTTTTYDAIERVRQVTEPDGAKTTTTYGNWTVSTTDHRGLITDRSYDAYEQLVQVVERLPVAQTTTIGYDLLGHRIRVVDAKGNVTLNAYDPLGRRLQSQDPDLGLWQYSYDDAGRVTSQRDARGVVLDLTYDALGRPLTRRSGATMLAAFAYDEPADGYANIGRLTSFIDPTGSTERGYDELGRLRHETKTIDGTAYRMDWGFDAAGRVISIQYPEVGGVREQVALTYDASGRAAAVGEYVGAITYDARGNLTAATYGNGATVTRTYSPARGWMLGQTVTAGGTMRDQFGVTRAPSGDITARTSTTEPRDAWQFTYDALGRLTAADNTVDNTLDEAFTYDAIGNRLSARRGSATSAYTYPAGGAARPHAPSVIAGHSVRYDANGNRLGIGAAPDAIYDEANKLVSDGTTTYAHDAEGTRVRAGNKVFVRDLFETDGATSTRYYFLGRERVARRDHTGAVTYYHGDSIGTVRTLSSSTGGVAGTRLTFAFGELAATTGTDDPFGLAGQRRDASGLYHMGARMMDPAHGQFTQPDPSGAPDPARPQTLNRYSYVLNNPIRLADPTGFQEKEEEELEDKPDTEDAEETEDKGPLKIRIRRATSETVQWTVGDPPQGPFQAPRLFSRSYDEARKRTPDASWAFQSRTGRLYASLEDRLLERDGYQALPFWTMGDALSYIDRSRADDRAYILTDDGLQRFDIDQPQYLEGADGSMYRYNEDSTIDVIRPDDVPRGVGIDQTLFIFREALSS